MKQTVIFDYWEIYDIVGTYCRHPFSVTRVRKHIKDEHGLSLKTSQVKKLLRRFGIRIRNGKPTFLSDAVLYLTRRIQTPRAIINL